MCTQSKGKWAEENLLRCCNLRDGSEKMSAPLPRHLSSRCQIRLRPDWY